MATSYKRRRELLRQVMIENNLDGYLVVDPINVSYLTGFNGDDSFLWLGDVDALILSDSRFEEQLKEEAPDVDAAIRVSGQTTYGLLKQGLADGKYTSRTPKRVALEAASTTLDLYGKLCETFSEIEFVPRSSDVETLRCVKDESEITAIRRAIAVSIEAYRSTKRLVGGDATEVDLRDELEYRMRKAGGDDVSFPSIVAYDARAALPHAIPGRAGRLCDANMVLIDWGAKRDYDVGDRTRSYLTEKGVSLGSAEYRRKFDEVFKIVLEAHDAAIAAIKPGVVCSDVDAIARNVIKDAGYGEYFGHGLGHGIGRVVHEFGGFSPNAKAKLQANMIMTVEPGVYLPGWGGIRIEDDVLVTEKGCEILSSSLPVDE